MSEQHKDLSERVELFKQFYKKENKRPLLGFFLGSEYPIERYLSMKVLPENIQLEPNDFPIERFLDDTENLYHNHELCGGDFIFTSTPYWGIPWLEAALGCSIYANKESGSLYSDPPPDFNGPNDIPSFDKSNPWIKLLDRYLLELAQKSSGRWPLGTTRMRGISDLLSALYGGTEWLFKMMDSPEEIRNSCQKLTDFWLQFAQHQIDRIPDFHGGLGSFYYYAWVPKGTVWCQEDATALLSPELYSQFIEPCIREISRTLKSSVIHQHTMGYVPFSSYKTMDFLAMEMHVDSGGPSAEELFDTHMEIMAKKPLIIWGNLSKKDLDWVFSKLPSSGLAIITVVESPEEASEIWEKYI